MGDDQLPMNEHINELVGRFNRALGCNVLVECDSVLSTVSCLLAASQHTFFRSTSNTSLPDEHNLNSVAASIIVRYSSTGPGLSNYGVHRLNGLRTRTPV